MDRGKQPFVLVNFTPACSLPFQCQIHRTPASEHGQVQTCCVGCRSDLANADEDKSDEKEDDFVKGFKVANFEIIASPDKGEPHSRCHCIDCPSAPCCQQHFHLITISYHSTQSRQHCADICWGSVCHRCILRIPADRLHPL